MSLTLEVRLRSGWTVSLQTHGDESMESLRVRAQKALEASKGRLVDSTGTVLDGGARLEKARHVADSKRRCMLWKAGLCCDPDGWFRCDLGQCSLRW